MKNILYSSLIFILCGLQLVQAAESYDPTSDLLFAFGSRCQSVGSISSGALNDSVSIRNLVQTIRDDASCAGITGALNSIDSLNIDALLNDKTMKNDQEYLASHAGDLEIAIATETKQNPIDQEYVDALKAELVTTKVKIIKSKNDPNREQQKKKLETIRNFQKYSNSLFAKLKSSDQCLQSRPSLAAQVSAQVLGLGSTLTSGVVGSLMLATGNLVDNFISYFHDKKLNGELKKGSSVALGEALGCSFEGMATTYCQARDVQTIITVNDKVRGKDIDTPSWLDGVDAVGQSMPAYENWAGTIDAGSPAGTAGRASDKKTAKKSQNDLSLVKIDLDQIFSESKHNLSHAETNEKRLDITRKALNDMAEQMMPKCSPGSCSPSPFAAVFASDQHCGPFIYLYSKGVDKVRKDSSQISCTQYVSTMYNPPPDLNVDVAPTLDRVMSEANSYVDSQLSQVNESNPNLVLTKIDALTANGHSAREFLQAAISYFDRLLQDPQSISRKPLQRSLIEKTKKQLQNALQVSERVEIPVVQTLPATIVRMIPVDASQNVADISRELIPNGDKSAVPKAISEIINQDIDDKIKRGELDQNLSLLMRLSASDSLSELIRFYVGVEPARAQARSSKELTKNNLNVLAGVFNSSLKDRFEKLKKAAKSDSEQAENLALLCMQALAIPDAPKIGDLELNEYCKGTVYYSHAEKSQIKMDYNELLTKDYSDRACAVYDFYRKVKLYDLKSEIRTSSPTGTK